MKDAPDLVLIKNYIGILVSLIVFLSSTFTIYVYYRDDILEKGNQEIDEFYMASATAYSRIKLALQSLHTHHAEEHLAHEGYANFVFQDDLQTHFRVIQDEMTHVTAIWNRHQELGKNIPKLQQDMENAIEKFATIRDIFSTNKSFNEIDIFYESARNDLQIFGKEIDSLEQTYLKLASEKSALLQTKKQQYNRNMIILLLILVGAGLWLGRKIFHMIALQIAQLLSMNHELNNRKAEAEKHKLEMDVSKRSTRAMVMALANLAENRDINTGEHVLRVARLSREIALEMATMGVEGINDTFLDEIALASMLHDLGKVTIPDQILLKPGPLDADERAIMQEHARAGSDFLVKVEELQENDTCFKMANRIALSHHEHFQGTGYPHGLSGTQIPLEARIVAVADVYDALISWRPYKTPWPEEKANAFITDNSGKMFDPTVVAAFVRVCQQQKEQSLFTWQEEMSVDIPVLDNDHKSLIQLVNQMNEAQKRLDWIMMELVLIELVNYTDRHFKREEEILQERNFPDYQLHKKEHSDFKNQVIQMRHRLFRETQPELATQFTNILGNWLIRHILRSDQAYRNWFHERATG
ncbi:MAG: bacteriohemerythrin [Magnetococcales bacterium]|nr:bacteriohemerythrin [Magnetococcales bacterium]